MTWRYAPDKAMKDTAESLLKKLRPLSEKECMDVIRDVQQNYRLPGKALENQDKGLIKIKNHAKVIAGNLRYDHKDREL